MTRSPSDGVPSLRAVAAVRERCAGYTLLEISVATAMLTVVLWGTWGLFSRSLGLFDQEMQRVELELTGLRVLDRLAELLRTADPATVQPLVLIDSPTISFQQVVDYQADAPVHGPVQTLTFIPTKELATGTVAGTGTDGALVLGRGGGPATTLASGLLDLRFSSTAEGVLLTAVVGRTDAEGVLHQRTFQQEVDMRH